LTQRRTENTELTFSQWFADEPWLDSVLLLYNLIHRVRKQAADPGDRARSMAWVCARFLAGIASLNPAGGMDVCVL
jgi:hypothetical protein